MTAGQSTPSAAPPPGSSSTSSASTLPSTVPAKSAHLSADDTAPSHSAPSQSTGAAATSQPPRRTSSLHPRQTPSLVGAAARGRKFFGFRTSASNTSTAPSDTGRTSAQALPEDSTAGVVGSGVAATTDASDQPSPPPAAAVQVQPTALEVEEAARKDAADKRRKMLQVREYILGELLLTEKNYVDHLGLVLELLRAPLVRAALGDKAPGGLTLQQQHSRNYSGSHLSKASLAPSDDTTATDATTTARTTLADSRESTLPEETVAAVEGDGEDSLSSSFIARSISSRRDRRKNSLHHDDHADTKAAVAMSQSLPPNSSVANLTLGSTQTLSAINHHSHSQSSAKSPSTASAVIIPMVDIKIMFAWIEELHTRNCRFCEELEAVVQAWAQSEAAWAAAYSSPSDAQLEHQPLSVAELFLRHSEDWKIYLKFVDNYSAAKEAIRRSQENSLAYRNFMAECMKSKDVKRQGISDFLILPIQRVTRYVLLLQDFKKHTPPDHPEFEAIASAMEEMRQLANTVNEVKRREEEMTRMFHVVRTVDDCPPTIISAHRRILFELEAMDATKDFPALGTHFPHLSTGISIVPSLGSMSTITMLQVETSGSVLRIFIFSDIMLIARPKGKQRKNKDKSGGHMSKLVGMGGGGSDAKKEKLALFRMAWLRDVEVVDLASAISTPRSGLGFSKNAHEKHLVKLVLHNSESATPTGRRRFWAELASANTLLAGAESSRAAAPAIGEVAEEEEEEENDSTDLQQQQQQVESSEPTEITITPAVDEGISEVQQSAAIDTQSTLRSMLPSVQSLEQMAMERLGMTDKSDTQPSSQSTATETPSISPPTTPSGVRTRLHRASTVHGTGRRTVTTPRTTSLSGTNPSITALVENMVIDKPGSASTGIVMTAPVATATNGTNNNNNSPRRRSTIRKNSFVSNPDKRNSAAHDLDDSSSGRDHATTIAEEEVVPDGQANTRRQSVTEQSAATITDSKTHARHGSAPAAGASLLSLTATSSSSTTATHQSQPPLSQLGSMNSMLAGYTEAKERSQQNVAEGFILEFGERKQKNELMLVVERLVLGKKMRAPGSRDQP